MRPTTNRLGAQQRFGGATNEYREDLGKNSPNRLINNQRESWKVVPDSGAGFFFYFKN